MNKIGILGGTFDPVHFGHLRLAQESQRQLGLEKIIFIPSAHPPHKLGVITDYERRRHWLNKVIANNRDWEISDLEQQRPGKSYTYDTLLELRGLYPSAQLYFLTGADSLVALGGWYRWQDILDLCYFVVTNRPGHKQEIPVDVCQVNEQAKMGIVCLEIDALPISSTEVREQLRAHMPMEQFIPPEIIDEVKQKWQ